jgi:sulfate transporter 4
MPPPPPAPPPGSPGSAAAATQRRASVDGATGDDSSVSRPTTTAPAHEFHVEAGSREFVPPTAPGGVRYPLPSGASAVLFDPRNRPLRLPSAGRSRAPSASGAPAPPITLPNTATPGTPTAGDTTPPGKSKHRKSKQPLPSWREEWQSVRRWWVRTRESGAKSARERTAFDWAAVFLPCLTWLRSYSIKENLMWDVLAGVSVGFMVVPQSMSYANLAGLAPQYGLYAAFVPLVVYAMFGEFRRWILLPLVVLGFFSARETEADWFWFRGFFFRVPTLTRSPEKKTATPSLKNPSGSCRQLGVGPVAITSSLIANGLKDQIPRAAEIDEPANPPPDLVAVQEAYSTRVIQLAFIVGCMYTAIGFLRLGFLVRFLSHSVIVGFTSGQCSFIE